MSYSEWIEEDRFGLVRRLRTARRNGRLAHAYLIYGDQPELRAGYAEIAAMVLACVSEDSDRVPCGHCESCRDIPKGTYRDMRTLEPVSRSRKILIGATDEPDTLRWFQDRFYLSSAGASGRKIGVILDADCLMPEAQNAFLKTLEEPPKGSRFVLTTGNPQALLPTVRSRCQGLSVLVNRANYGFDGAAETFAVTAELSGPPGGLARAERCVSRLLGVAAGLKEEAERRVVDKWSARLAQTTKDTDPSAVKAIEEKHKAAVQAEYLRLRQSFLSAVHAWFAQVYQLSEGVALSDLGNPEMFPEGFAVGGVDPAKAFRDLEAAERFLASVQRTGVNEDLAFRVFCATTQLAVGE